MDPRVAVLFGTETGNSQECAEALAAALREAGVPAESIDMGEYPPARLTEERLALIITSTFGNGDPPANAQDLLDYVSLPGTQLPHLQYGVCALGDSTYPLFAQCGKDFDERLELRGGSRVIERVDCDGGFDFEVPFEEFRDSALAFVETHWARIAAAGSADASATVADDPVPADDTTGASWTRTHPFLAKLAERRSLSGPGSAKSTLHYAIDLVGGEIDYAPGDCFGVYPENDPSEVDALLAALEIDPESEVRAGAAAGRAAAAGLSVREVLLTRTCLQRLPLDLLRLLQSTPGPSSELLADPDGLHAFAPEHHVLDLARAHPGARVQAQALVDALRSLAPRLYSIASSQAAHPGEVHFTIDTVRYPRRGRSVAGVASTWFAERLSVGDTVPVYLQPNERFRLPADERPILMIGPGTGVAPFRAFLEELRVTGAKNDAWLFFGHQHVEHDFLYRDELEGFQADGVLDRLSLAWSRDQDHKIYVQQRLAEEAAEVWSWLERGANVYVCGDASAMAPAVRAAFESIAADVGGVTDAGAWMNQLEDDGRYSQDVY